MVIKVADPCRSQKTKARADIEWTRLVGFDRVRASAKRARFEDHSRACGASMALGADIHIQAGGCRRAPFQLNWIRFE